MVPLTSLKLILTLDDRVLITLASEDFQNFYELNALKPPLYFIVTVGYSFQKAAQKCVERSNRFYENE